MTLTSKFDRVRELFDQPGAARFYGEAVTIADHMLQAAALALRASAADSQVAAALLHDVGHLVDPSADDDSRNRDHARLGHEALVGWLPEAVTEPVRLHIAAKRYLVATDPSYARLLSPASVHTLELQGGPLSSAECARFEEEPHADAALLVRRWDDEAKVPGLSVPPLEQHRALLERLTSA